jgi:hypothetical protein
MAVPTPLSLAAIISRRDGNTNADMQILETKDATHDNLE